MHDDEKKRIIRCLVNTKVQNKRRANKMRNLANYNLQTRSFQPSQLQHLFHVSFFYESIEHADDTVVRFGNKICFKN